MIAWRIIIKFIKNEIIDQNRNGGMLKKMSY